MTVKTVSSGCQINHLTIKFTNSISVRTAATGDSPDCYYFYTVTPHSYWAAACMLGRYSDMTLAGSGLLNIKGDVFSTSASPIWRHGKYYVLTFRTTNSISNKCCLCQHSSPMFTNSTPEFPATTCSFWAHSVHINDNFP